MRPLHPVAAAVTTALGIGMATGLLTANTADHRSADYAGAGTVHSKATRLTVRVTDVVDGDTATALLATLAPPGTITTLSVDPQQPDRDVYGRLLRYVDHRGNDLSQALLEAGAAHLYASDPPLTRASDHQAAAEDARDKARGLWRVC